MFNVYIKDIKKGDRFWECEAGENIEYEALEDASLSEGDWWSVLARDVKAQSNVYFGVTNTTNSYHPHLYSMPMYATPSDLN